MSLEPTENLTMINHDDGATVQTTTRDWATERYTARGAGYARVCLRAVRVPPNAGAWRAAE
jgi:hypothetical protein